MSRGPRRLFSPCSRPFARILGAGCAMAVASLAFAQSETIPLDLTLVTGGSLSGLVVDHTAHGLVIVRDRTPYVFAWDEIEAASALAAWRKLMILERGGSHRLTAEDYFQQGMYALSRRRREAAVAAFEQAMRLDASYRPRARQALAEDKIARKKNGVEDPFAPDNAEAPPLPDDPAAFPSDSCDVPPAPWVELASSETREQVLAVYRTFGEKVREVLGSEVVGVETAHFLIWTDWSPRDRPRLERWCEAMYDRLCEQFGLPTHENIFLAKCPVFVWQHRRNHLKFASYFDGHDGRDAVGYTRSIEKNGHVHLVLLRQGRTESDFDRFACTLVHEGAHAFLHRLYSTRLIPHWVNEGCADLMAERVLGDRCPNAENAALLAKQYTRHGWSIADLLNDAGPIEVHQYPLAHSVVAYLESLGRDRFAAFIRSLKQGATVAEALTSVYDGLTIERLEEQWREETSKRQNVETSK